MATSMLFAATPRRLATVSKYGEMTLVFMAEALHSAKLRKSLYSPQNGAKILQISQNTFYNPMTGL